MIKRILITGAAGYIGHQLGNQLAVDSDVLGIDIRSNPQADFPIEHRDIRDPKIGEFMKEAGITHVVHLASILQSSQDPERDYDIDVNGTQNLLEACIDAGVRHLTVTSSGAAYGYHPDNPPWIDENDPLRGNQEFPYAYHKRLVEQLLASYRDKHPELEQLIFRPGTVLGAHTRNQITGLFLAPRVLRLRGSDSPFVFIWDQDVIRAMEQGIRQDQSGIFNMAGDGALTIREIADKLGKPVITLPVPLVRTGLRIARLMGRPVGPEQVNFLRYRPVLDNRRLKEEFGYQPEKTSAQTLEFFIEQARLAGEL
ncbi:SDR family oxidoreductase [uncultured Marinobacter sp.]|uniref:SDR family oxidoreductase n=1 Tax=uncultured Marinobacter sp. TaxID=187379 RepID=UPI0026051AD4|nr:SDR family oxidoreductase [uncultured Marinobacter sp.]